MGGRGAEPSTPPNLDETLAECGPSILEMFKVNATKKEPAIEGRYNYTYTIASKIYQYSLMTDQRLQRSVAN